MNSLTVLNLRARLTWLWKRTPFEPRSLNWSGQIPRSQSPRTLQHPSVRSTRCDITAFVYVCFQRPTVLDIKVRNLEHGNSTVFVSIRRRAADLFILKKEIFVRSVCLVRRVCCWVSLNVSQSAHAFCLLEFPTFFIARVPDTSTAVIYRINLKKKGAATTDLKERLFGEVGPMHVKFLSEPSRSRRPPAPRNSELIERCMAVGTSIARRPVSRCSIQSSSRQIVPTS
jgi:hypothetical protein